MFTDRIWHHFDYIPACPPAGVVGYAVLFRVEVSAEGEVAIELRLLPKMRTVDERGSWMFPARDEPASDLDPASAPDISFHFWLGCAKALLVGPDDVHREDVLARVWERLELGRGAVSEPTLKAATFRHAWFSQMDGGGVGFHTWSGATFDVRPDGLIVYQAPPQRGNHEGCDGR